MTAVGRSLPVISAPYPSSSQSPRGSGKLLQQIRMSVSRRVAIIQQLP